MDKEAVELEIVKSFYRAIENLEHTTQLGLDEVRVGLIIAQIKEELKKFRGY